MFLKNYTSDVPVSQTIYRIEQVLIKCGVSGITKEYGTNAKVTAITFHIAMEGMPTMTIRLPADEAAATQALWLDYADGDKLTADGNSLHWNTRKKKSKADFVEQGERTAWKIIQDWVEIQMSMIQTHQAEWMQVFLPYVWDGKKTYYQAVKANNFRAMLPERTE